ncbi:uncharacterized protein BJ171DRAFT_509746 [Polychytrium aggregatum]|uniref:uncharacterized protein n=1 Tax=Polychytrium aggregatum TaxID=110093 RepID=UPI0022FEF84E|nr:uncharacterized protein BJ171DRAFT_509746 [Polychytrium aggregatum]KAI9203484.1 hypothetical protein BJ171DRAFT_509746 [Polychytrium aggregatum]
MNLPAPSARHRPPTGIGSLVPDTVVSSFYGVVVSLSEIRKSKGTDCVMSVILSDPSYPQGMAVNIFRPTPEMFPVVAKEDILKCHHIRISRYSGRLQGVSTRGSQFVVVDTLDSRRPPPTRPSLSEADIAISTELRHWRTSTIYQPSASKSGVGRRCWARRTGRANGAGCQEYCDMFVQIVHKCEGGSGERLVLLVTDYTANPRCFAARYNPGADDPVLPSDMLINLTLWDNHAVFGSQFKQNDYVWFQNVHVRKRSDGLVELSIHGDAHKKCGAIVSADDQRIDGLIRRELKFKLKNQPISDVTPIGQQWPTRKTLRELSQEREGYFVCKVKVLDYRPVNLRDFTCQLCPDCNARGQPGMQLEQCPSCGSIAIRNSYVYMFSLLVTDDTHILPVGVSHDDGRHLLGVPPSDLHADEHALKQLKNSLGRVWNTETDSSIARPIESTTLDIGIYVAQLENSVTAYKLCGTELVHLGVLDGLEDGATALSTETTVAAPRPAGAIRFG